MKRVTSLGGIFFKCEDPEKMKKWYSDHLGLKTDEYGTNFEWRKSSDPTMKGFTVWSPFSNDSKYFDPSKKDFMINYRVDNIEALIDILRKEGVTILDDIDSSEYGKFIHVMDPEGNKIELWEPVDDEFDRMIKVRMTE